jgi:hypothetical protein
MTLRRSFLTNRPCSRTLALRSAVVLSYAILTSAGGCTALPGSNSDAMKFIEPDAAFMKKVEKDPFPKAANMTVKVTE